MKKADLAPHEVLASDEVRRAQNIQWTISERYDTEPENVHLGEDGEALVYENAIEGAASRMHDERLIDQFRLYLLKQSAQGAVFGKMLDLAIETGVSERLSEERPAIAWMRKDRARAIKRKYEYTAPHDEIESLQKGHAERILGEVPKLSRMMTGLLNDIEAAGRMDTPQMLESMNELLKKHFYFDPTLQAEIELQQVIKKKKSLDIPPEDVAETELEKQFSVQSAEFTQNIYLDDSPKEDLKDTPVQASAKQDNEEQLRAFMEQNYGVPSMSERSMQKIQALAAQGIHEKAKLLITKGELPETATDYRKRVIREAREQNEAYINERHARVYRSIRRLADRIKNTIVNEIDEGRFRADHGDLQAALVWRSLYTSDRRVFQQVSYDEPGSISVDLLLDASASQQVRAQEVAMQGYIIASALRSLDIPVRASTFQSQQGYTVIRQLLDYGDIDTTKLLDYFPDAANRDGFAFRVAHLRMNDSPRERRILIVLSDGKPFDERAKVNTRRNNKKDGYSGDQAIDDAAAEIRRLRLDGIPTLGVFTGEEEDVEAAKRIYGVSFAYVRDVERFAEIVSTFLREEIKNRQ